MFPGSHETPPPDGARRQPQGELLRPHRPGRPPGLVLLAGRGQRGHARGGLRRGRHEPDQASQSAEEETRAAGDLGPGSALLTCGRGARPLLAGQNQGVRGHRPCGLKRLTLHDI